MIYAYTHAQHELHLARKDFARDDRLWTAKRMQLEMQLNRGFFVHGAVGSGNSATSATTSSSLGSSGTLPANFSLTGETQTYC